MTAEIVDLAVVRNAQSGRPCADWCAGHYVAGECMKVLGVVELALEEPLNGGPGIEVPAALEFSLERRGDGVVRFTVCSPGGEVFSLSLAEVERLLEVGATARALAAGKRGAR